MKSFVITCVFFALIALAICEDEPKGCKIDDHFFAVGDSYKPEGKCHEATCDEHDSFHLKACPAEAVADPENYDLIKEDTTKPYPECCEHYKKKTE